MDEELFKETVKNKLANITNLVSIDLSGSSFDCLIMIDLYSSIKSYLPNLKKLNVAHCNISDGIDFLIYILQDATKLENLTLKVLEEEEGIINSIVPHISPTVKTLTISGPPCPISKISSMLSCYISRKTTEPLDLIEMNIATNMYASNFCHSYRQQIRDCVESIADSYLRTSNISVRDAELGR